MGLGGIDSHLKVAELERRVRTLTMVLGLLLMLVRVSRARLAGKRLPDVPTQQHYFARSSGLVRLFRYDRYFGLSG